MAELALALPEPDASGSWPDAEKLGVRWLETHVPTTDVAGQTREVSTWRAGEIGPNEEQLVPFLSVERVGGIGRDIDRDVDLEIGAWAPDRASLWPLVQRIEVAMRALAANGSEQYVDDVAETFAFALDPYPNQSVRRAIATYTLTVRPLR
ncbi:hypothetical protein NSA53_14880 [Cellulosimicrobium cellulans]|uniref:hypothetical protein n=1 Tax=Cellulosimicrobium cellulans TaxID=1710 RepID=UPI00214A4988|nr:hypothetical protein [Cellulosimicrobium cellulans]